MVKKVFSKVNGPLSRGHSLLQQGGGPLLTLGASLALNGALWALTLTLFPAENPDAVLHYSVGIGVDFIGQGKQINLLPASGLALLLFNTTLAAALRRQEAAAAWIIFGATPFIQLILLVSFLLIWRANG